MKKQCECGQFVTEEPLSLYCDHCHTFTHSCYVKQEKPRSETMALMVRSTMFREGGMKE